LTDLASAAATSQDAHYLTFLRPEAPVSCMRLLGGGGFHIRGPWHRYCSMPRRRGARKSSSRVPLVSA
jgi:hypothetical protein